MNNKSGSEGEIPWLKPCGHEPPQGNSQLHGVCLFCYRDRLGHLQKLVEEQRDLVAMFQLVLDGANHAKNLLNAQSEERKGEIERLKLELVLSKEANRNLNDILGSLDVDDPKAVDALLETMKMQKSQLAAQTERVRRLEEALKHSKPLVQFLIARNPQHEEPHKALELIEQALNQERLGDGGKGEAR